MESLDYFPYLRKICRSDWKRRPGNVALVVWLRVNCLHSELNHLAVVKPNRRVWRRTIDKQRSTGPDEAPIVQLFDETDTDKPFYGPGCL